MAHLWSEQAKAEATSLSRVPTEVRFGEAACPPRALRPVGRGNSRCLLPGEPEALSCEQLVTMITDHDLLSSGPGVRVPPGAPMKPRPDLHSHVEQVADTIDSGTPIQAYTA
jgi:hypothetical protein